MFRARRIEPGPGQESVWDYPRPPLVAPFEGQILIEFNGVLLVDTRRAIKVAETASAPVYYIPPDDIQMQYLQRVSGRTSLCEWKGQASYYTIAVGNRQAEAAAWTYHTPREPFISIKDHLAFYARPMDSCTIDGEQVRPQPGGFYGGWVTDNIVGPFKGEPGTEWW